MVKPESGDVKPVENARFSGRLLIAVACGSRHCYCCYDDHDDDDGDHNDDDYYDDYCDDDDHHDDDGDHDDDHFFALFPRRK